LNQDHRAWEPGTILLGEYRIEKALGHGGTGSVYLVERVTDRRQFAVKTLLHSLLDDANKHRQLLHELRTWMDLPEHPHLVSCRFFRTIEDRLAIFSEYIDGGSLEDWIGNRRLLRVDSILDVSIQMARGIQAAHHQGVIHKDIKPANVLMTTEGIAKITDFGIALLRRNPEGTALLTSVDQYCGVTAGGLTPAYCSPEQAMGLDVNHQTDIWSWGVTILELFTGTVTWPIGALAGNVLREYLRREPAPPHPGMPDELAEVLSRCFRHNPHDRWHTIEEAARRLEQIYCEVTGNEYFREAVAIGISGKPEIPHDRQIDADAAWDDPVVWLEKAWAHAGRRPDDTRRKLPRRIGSRTAQALVDLEVFQEAETAYAALMNEQSAAVRDEFAQVLYQKALLCEHLSDFPASAQTYDRLIELFQASSDDPDLPALKYESARAMDAKSRMMLHAGEVPLAVELSRAALQSLVSIEGITLDTDTRKCLASAYMNHAKIALRQGTVSMALEATETAIELLELIHDDQQIECSRLLALALMDKAVCLFDLADYSGSLEFHDRSIRIWRNLIEMKGRQDLAQDLALVYVNQANALCKVERYSEAIALYDRAIEIRERLVYSEGRHELLSELAMDVMNKAITLRSAGRVSEAIRVYRKAEEILKPLIEKEGRTELRDDLAWVYMNMANAYYHDSAPDKALELYTCAIELWDLLRETTRHRKITHLLSYTWRQRAIVLQEMGRYDEAMRDYDTSIDRLVSLAGDEPGSFEADLLVTKAYRIQNMSEMGDRDTARVQARELIPLLEAERDRGSAFDLQTVIAFLREL